MTKTSETYGYSSTFPTNLRNLMAEKKVTNKRLSEICSVKAQSVSLWINGETRPDILSLVKIAKYFNVSTDFLLGLNDYETTDKATKELCSTLGLSEDSINLLLKNTPLYFEEWEKADGINTCNIAQTVMILDALLKDHIDYLTNKDNRKAEEKHSLLKLLYSYLEHTALSGSATVHSGGKFLSINDVSERFSIQQHTESGIFADNLYSYKDLLLAQDIQKITAFLQNKNIKGIDREISKCYVNKIGGDKQ